MTKNQKQKSFKEYLQEIEDPKNNSEVNYALPENPTPLQVAKFEICQEILGYKLDNDLTREQRDKQSRNWGYFILPYWGIYFG